MHERHKEHMERQDGIIKKHAGYCVFPNFVTDIIDTVYGDNELVLRIKEAIHIRNQRPELNKKEELNILLDAIL